MLPATVMCGHSAYDWNIIAVARFSGGSRVMSSPPTRMTPSSGITKPAIERNNVVLPQPELPSSAIISPRSTPRLTWSSTRVAAVGNGKVFDRKVRCHRLTAAELRALPAQCDVSVYLNCDSGHAAAQKTGSIE